MSERKIIEIDYIKKGLEQATIKNRTIIGFSCHRFHINELLSLEIIKNNVGVYLLIGDNEEDNYRFNVYVGETENMLIRLKNHLQKEFWNHCLVFVNSKFGEINKAHIKVLESIIYEDLKNADQCVLINNKIPTKSSLISTAEFVTEEFKRHIYLLLKHFGFGGLTEIIVSEEEKEEKEPMFYLQKNGVEYGKMKITSDGYKIYKGAKLITIPKYFDHNSVKSYYVLREKLKKENFIECDEQNEAILLKDLVFKSPSGSAVFILGRPVNGRIDWKTKEGFSLKDIELKKLTTN